jgi:phytoene dehydrogenase-like protein
VTYDVAIIGAGLSGLAAGIRLAYYDRRVVILERHTTVGGLNSFYRLRGRNHDVGLHAVTNYFADGAKGGALHKILRQLRLRREDFDLSPQRGSAIAFPGVRLRFTNDLADLTAEIAAAFPGAVDGFRRLVARIADCRLSGWDPSGLSARSVVAEELREPLLAEMLLCPLLFYGSAAPFDMDFHQFVIMFRSVFQEGFGRPFEGIRRILKVLVRKFKQQGGELRLRSGVRALESRGGRVAALVLDSGETIEAANVVSSAGALETLAMCGGPRPTGPRPGRISYVETIFSLDREPSELGFGETVLFFNDSDRFRYRAPEEPVDLHAGIVCSPNNYEYGRPLDEGRLRVTALANPDYWLGLADDEYARNKPQACARLVESALRFVPDFRPAVVDTDIFTPRTIRKYTGHVNGCIYGAADKHSSGRTHLENLYLCGNDQGLVGIVGTMMSGIAVANEYLLK